jgi:hypothetical protein
MQANIDMKHSIITSTSNPSHAAKPTRADIGCSSLIHRGLPTNAEFALQSMLSPKFSGSPKGRS